MISMCSAYSCVIQFSNLRVHIAVMSFNLCQPSSVSINFASVRTIFFHLLCCLLREMSFSVAEVIDDVQNAKTLATRWQLAYNKRSPPGCRGTVRSRKHNSWLAMYQPRQPISTTESLMK